jgi:hypothetical protein
MVFLLLPSKHQGLWLLWPIECGSHDVMWLPRLSHKKHSVLWEGSCENQVAIWWGGQATQRPPLFWLAALLRSQPTAGPRCLQVVPDPAFELSRKWAQRWGGWVSCCIKSKPVQIHQQKELGHCLKQLPGLLVMQSACNSNCCVIVIPTWEIQSETNGFL